MNNNVSSIINSGIWLPLKVAVRGRVVRNLTTTEATRSINPHLVDLWYGSEVFAVEVLRVASSNGLAQETWLRGYVVGNPSIRFEQIKKIDPTSSKPEPSVQTGVFPAGHVQWDHQPDNPGGPTFKPCDTQAHSRGTVELPILESLSIARSRSTSGTDTIISCIQDSIQDWSSRLPVYLANRQYKLFDGVTKEIQLLASYRLQLDSGILTKKQDNRVRVEALKTLNRGNALQGLDVVVRHPETGEQPVVNDGNQGDWIVTPLRLYLAQLATASLNAPKISPEETRLSNLYLTHQGKGIPTLRDVRSAIRNPSNPAEASKYLVAEVKAIIIRTDPGESLELYLSIYDNTPTKKAFITEEFLSQAIKGGHITEKSSVAFEIGGNNGSNNSLYLVVKVVRVVIGGMDGSYRRYPFGVSVTPLSGLLDTSSEKVLQVEPWARGSVFSSMHEELVERKNTASASKHRIVIGMQMSPTNRIVRNAALCRSLSGSSPVQDVADVYIKLWSAVLPDPIPDEVYVKMTLYSTDQHRLVDCIFPGGSGSGMSSEGALEYKSVVWQKTPSTSTPVFGDLVRFRISRQHLQSGYVQFSIMAADRASEMNAPQGSNEWVAFSVEMPLASNPGNELWVQDGEHILVSPNPACALTVRALSLVPFGFKDVNIAYALTQPPGDISVDRISLLSYAPVDELKRHAGKLLDYLFSAMLANTTNFPLHAAVLDVLATFLEEELLQVSCAVCTLGPGAKRQAVQLLLEAVSLALSDRSRRNSTIKCLSMVCRLGRLMLDASFDGQEAIRETLSAIRSQLVTIASSKDDHVGQTLALRHWPFATFGDPEDIIKLMDCIRPNTVSEHKSKMRFVIQVLDELALDESLVAALWRNIKNSLSKADDQALDVIHLATSACGRIIDATCRDDIQLDDVLEYIGADVLQALLKSHSKVANGLDGLNGNGSSNIIHALPSQIIQTTCPAGAEIVVRDIQACIVCVVNRLSPGLEQMLRDLDGGVLADLQDLTWAFLHSVARLTTSRPAMASYVAFETRMWLRLCRAMFETVAPDHVASREHLATVVALVRHSQPQSSANGGLEGDDDAVHCLRILCRLAAGPESFSKIIDLALEAGSLKIRDVCHEVLFTISAGAPNVEVEAFLLLLVHAFVEGSHKVSRITMLVQEASAVWLTPENGWSAALEILPRLYGALENQYWTHPRHGTAFIALLELVMPFPSVRKALILQLYNHIFDAEGTSTANLLLELAVLCEDPEDNLSLCLHGHVAPRSLRVSELHEAAINEAIFMCDLGLAGRILASLTVVAEREGDYRRVSEILTYRSRLGRMMQEGSPVWRYLYVRLIDGEMIELIWRARHCEDLLHQVQRAYPEQTIALRERADRTPVPPETDILLVEVDIEPSQPPKPLWAKHDNVCSFTLDLVEGDLAVYEVDSPLPGFLPFVSVKTTTRVVQTEEEVIARKMRGTIEMLAYTLNGMGTTDSNGLSNLLDAAIEDVLMTTNVSAGHDDPLVDYLSLLLKGLDMHSRMTRGTPMETFHKSLVVNYESRYPVTIREKAELDFSAKNGSKAGMDLLALAFGSAGSSEKRNHPDRPSEDTLVHGRSAYSDALSPVSTTDAMPYVHVHQSQSPQFFSNPFSPKTTPRNGSFSPYPMSDRGSLMDRSDSVVSPVTRSPSVASRRIPIGVRRLGSLLSKSRSGSTSSGVV